MSGTTTTFAYVEMVLYHALHTTGAIEVSLTSSSGPWTKFQLTSAKGVQDALAEWAALAAAEFSETFDWAWSDDSGDIVVELDCSVEFWVRMPATLASLLGMSTEIMHGNTTITSDTDILGVLKPLAMGRTQPRAVETTELEEFRLGRAQTYTHSRRREVSLDLYFDEADAESILQSPIASGHAAFYAVMQSVDVDPNTADDYDEDNLGGRLLVFPVDTPVSDQSEGRGEVCLTILGTLRESVAEVGAAKWDQLMGAIPYGYKPFYIWWCEGIPVLFVEQSTSQHSGGAPITVFGLELDNSLVIDDSPRIGADLDEKNHLSKAFDLDIRILDTPAMRTLMERPTRMTTLTADLTKSATVLEVESARGWDTIPKPGLYYGTSYAPTTWGYLWEEFNSVDRGGVYGPARSYRKGTLVTDRPRRWTGRPCALYIALIDPLGRTVQGDTLPETEKAANADVLTDACMIWSGHIHKRPKREGSSWFIRCRDQIRRLTEPLGIAASGTAAWSLDDDHALYVDSEITLSVDITMQPGGQVTTLVVLPFVGGTQPIPRSQIRKRIVDALTAAAATYTTGSGDVVSFDWRIIRVDLPSGGLKRTWQLIAHVDTDSQMGGFGSIHFKIQATGKLVSAGLRVAGLGYMTTYTNDAADVIVECPFYQETQVDSASLAITLKEGTYARLPSAGWVLLEHDGKADYWRYLSKAQDDNDYRKVLLELAPEASTGDNLQVIARDELAGDTAEVNAKFLWRDTGSAADIMRRSIVSSGDAINGAYDTLPKGQGYDLPYLDADSFEAVLDGGFSDLSFDLAVEGGSSFEDLFGGLLRLAQRGITNRRSSDGTELQVAAINVGSPDGVPVATITDDSFVALDGRRPIRERATFPGPNAIEVSAHRLPVGTLAASEAELEFNDEHLTDWTTERWELEVHGLPRSALELPASAWARAWFRGGENRQVVEMDLAPDFPGQAGDLVFVNVVDPTLFDYAVGTAGLVGLGRILGCLFSLQTGVVTAIVQVDGVNTPGPMSPSLPISAVNGTATDPDSIDVSDVYLALLQYAKGDASTWKLIAYLPGQDAGRAEYTVTDIDEPGGGVARLTVTAAPSSPAVTLTTAYRLTWPIEDNSTEEQNHFLHASHNVQWS